MAKKTKRQDRREGIPAPDKFGVDPLVTNRASGFNPDYGFVIQDIRRVGILAGSFIVILVALSFFLK